jgi:type III secretion protein C
MGHQGLSLWLHRAKSRIFWFKFVLACCCLLSFHSVAASADKLKLPDGEYPYRIVDQDLTVVLHEFGQNLGLRVKLSPKVLGQVKGGFPRSSALAFLNAICRMYGLDWYYDGSTLHVTSVTEEVTRFLPVRKETPARLTENLKRLSFYDERFSLRPNTDNTSVVISGPPAYVALVEQTLSSMQRGFGDIPAQTVIYRGATVTVEKFGPDNAH